MKFFISTSLIATLVALHSTSVAQSNPEPDLRGTWTVVVDGNPETRRLKITGVPTETGALVATYGLSGGGVISKAKVSRVGDHRQVTFVTQADAIIVADEQLDGTFRGTFTPKGGAVKGVTVSRVTAEELAAAEPKDLSVIVPLVPDVPRECAAFHGSWAGIWSKGGGLQVYLRVPEVISDGRGGCVVRYRISSTGGLAPARDHINIPVGGDLTFSSREGTIRTFKRVGSDIWASLSSPLGADYSNRAVLHRVPE
jgi:hypothetical protein